MMWWLAVCFRKEQQAAFFCGTRCVLLDRPQVPIDRRFHTTRSVSKPTGQNNPHEFMLPAW